MQYRIVSVTSIWSVANGLEKLARLVNEAIADGWEPVGGVCIHAPNLAQAMIKRR